MCVPLILSTPKILLPIGNLPGYKAIASYGRLHDYTNAFIVSNFIPMCVNANHVHYVTKSILAPATNQCVVYIYLQAMAEHY